jgi:large subunit ribosomal protein L35
MRHRRSCPFARVLLKGATSLNRPAGKGCRGGSLFARFSSDFRGFGPLESKMPKLKTKSGAKKRFKITATGKVMYAQSGKRHGMIKRTKKQIRDHRGTKVLFKSDGDNIIKYFLPNG